MVLTGLIIIAVVLAFASDGPQVQCLPRHPAISPLALPHSRALPRSETVHRAMTKTLTVILFLPFARLITSRNCPGLTGQVLVEVCSLRSSGDRVSGTALGLSEAPGHEPVHRRRQTISVIVTQRSGRGLQYNDGPSDDLAREIWDDVRGRGLLCIAELSRIWNQGGSASLPGHLCPAELARRALSVRALILETGPVTERLRAREIDDDEGRPAGADRPPGHRVRGDLAAALDGAAVSPGHGRARDRESRLHQRG